MNYQEGLSEPEWYSDLIHKIRKIGGKTDVFRNSLERVSLAT